MSWGCGEVTAGGPDLADLSKKVAQEAAWGWSLADCIHLWPSFAGAGGAGGRTHLKLSGVDTFVTHTQRKGLVLGGFLEWVAGWWG